MRAVLRGLLLLGAMCGSAVAAAKNLRPFSGRVSWYGRAFAGRRTAGGKRYNPGAFTAASRTLPMGTHLRLTDRKTGKSVTVTVTDRGPLKRSRILDISEAAARRLGILKEGTAVVRIEPTG